MGGAVSFAQGKSLLIGSEQEISSLAKSDCASVAVFSDSHGGVKNFINVLKNCDNCAALIFCGDGGADFATVFNSIVTNDFRFRIPPVIAFVRGNNDMPMFALKNPSTSTLVNIENPLEQCLTVAGHKIFISHGHRYGVSAGIDTISDKARQLDSDVALFGHTHLATASTRTGILVLNPGSVSLPRGGQPKCFAKIFLEQGREPRDYVFFELTDGEAKLFKGPYIC